MILLKKFKIWELVVSNVYFVVGVTKMVRIVIMFYLFVLQFIYADLLTTDSFGIKPLLFSENDVLISAAAEEYHGYDITVWSAGAFLPFGRYKLSPYIISLDSERYYTETSVFLNNTFFVYDFGSDVGSGVYVILVPKLINHSYGKLAETGDPAFRNITKAAVDIGVLVRYRKISGFVYSKNLNKPNFGVIENDVVKSEEGVKAYFNLRTFWLSIGWQSDGVYSGELIVNYPSFCNLLVSKTSDSVAYGLSLNIYKIVFGLKYTIFEFTTKPMLFLEYRL
jgi:hypothetical protein